MFSVLLKKQFGETFKYYFYDAKHNRMRSKLSIALWFALYVFLVVGLFGGMFTSLALALCANLAEADAAWLYFGLMGVAAILLGSFGSAFNSYATLYQAKDNDLLLSLPVTAGDVLGARLSVVYLLGTLYAATSVVPAIVVYQLIARPGLAVLLFGLVFLLIISVIVLCLGCLFGWVVARISLKVKHKSLITVLAAVAFMALYYVGYFIANEAIKDFIVHAADYAQGLRGSAYPLYLFGSVGAGKLAPTVLYIGVAGLMLALTWLLLSRSYFSIITTTERTEKTRYVERRAEQRTPFAALLTKEFSKFSSSPNYMLNCGIGILFMLVVGVAMLIQAPTIREVLSQMQPESLASIAVLVSGALCLMAASNDMAAPSISLEGRNIWLLQSLPVHPKLILRAKLTVQFILTAVPLAFMVACFVFVVPLPPALKSLVCLTPFAFALFISAAATALGVRLANLSWTNEIMPIKQGAAVGIALFGGWGTAILSVVPYFVLGSSINPQLYLGILVVLFVGAAALLLRWLDTTGAELFSAL
ncbi:MAG: hypothetical protein Q4B54_05015 [Coriobacteriales bacterium]|nr:hypothetical protein [Coriobacteriales bacterium]